MNTKLTPPKEIVAKALGLSVDVLNDSSTYGETPNWDSLNHISIINELEKNYNIKIPDEEIEKYYTMEAINKLYDSLK